MIYIYRPASSTSARELAEAVEGRRWRLDRHGERVRSGDVVVCWGAAAPRVPNGVTVLNGVPLRTKFDDAVTLRGAGVQTVEVSRSRPQVVITAPAVDPMIGLYRTLQEEMAEFEETLPARTRPYQDGIEQLRTRLVEFQTALRTAAPVETRSAPQGEWVGRENSHMGGSDLLVPTTNPEYFSRKENFTQEFRVHSFNGRSLRAGVKVPRNGMTPHPWIRSWDGGWRINYDGVTARQAQRDIAHAAVEALGLTFGAVDIGQRADNSLVVLEVNRAPGLEGGTISAYARAIGGNQ